MIRTKDIKADGFEQIKQHFDSFSHWCDVNNVFNNARCVVQETNNLSMPAAFVKRSQPSNAKLTLKNYHREPFLRIFAHP